MIDYSKFDLEFYPWVKSKGYKVQTKYRDDEVRSFIISSKNGLKQVQIGVVEIDENFIVLRLFDFKNRRDQFKGTINDVILTLNKAEELALSWI